MIMWIYTIEPSLEIIQFEASETRGEYKVAYSEIIYVGFKLPKWPRRPVWIRRTAHGRNDTALVGMVNQGEWERGGYN